jgi:hypothetical protein
VCPRSPALFIFSFQRQLAAHVESGHRFCVCVWCPGHWPLALGAFQRHSSPVYCTPPSVNLLLQLLPSGCVQRTGCAAFGLGHPHQHMRGLVGSPHVHNSCLAPVRAPVFFTAFLTNAPPSWAFAQVDPTHAAPRGFRMLCDWPSTGIGVHISACAHTRPPPHGVRFGLCAICHWGAGPRVLLYALLFRPPAGARSIFWGTPTRGCRPAHPLICSPTLALSPSTAAHIAGFGCSPRRPEAAECSQSEIFFRFLELIYGSLLRKYRLGGLIAIPMVIGLMPI